jgi:hypothetical protein
MSILACATRLHQDGINQTSRAHFRPDAKKEPPMKFALLGYHPENNWAAMSSGEQDAMLQECFAYDATLAKDGYFAGEGTALRPTGTAKTLRSRNGAVIVTDGPFAETKEILGGVGVLEATDMAHAVELLSKHPGLRHGTTLEIRPIDEESLQRQATALAALRPSSVAADPQSVKFASLGYMDPTGWRSISESERADMLKSVVAFDEARVKSGQFRSGIALKSAGTAKTLRAKAGKTVVTDGPFAETKEYLGGIVVLAFKSLDDGVAALAQHPALAFGLAIEIRPIDEETSGRARINQGRAGDRGSRP